MALEITAIRMDSGGTLHEHITAYQWRDLATGQSGQSTKPAMVDWIDHQSGIVYVGSGSERVGVGVVHPDHTQPYLRTHADGQWTNNLLSLPRF